MRTHTIALIANADSDAARTGWWEAILRHWPEGAPPPRLELVTPEILLTDGRALKSLQGWDAAILAPVLSHLDTAACQAIDILQQSMVPAILLVAEPPARLDTFHPGAVVVQPMSAPPASTAAMLYALAQRQPALRTLEQSVRLAQSFQGETAAEMDRLQQELLLAAKVQRDFLPKHMPASDTVESAVLFRPAGFVSGDTYDIVQLDEHRIGFFLADAMGHGVPAALMTLYVTGSLPRREVTGDGVRLIEPAESLERLNAELHESIAGPTRFVTAVCGTIDTRTGRITIACAGHPAPLRISEHGVRPVDVGGMLLGVVPDTRYQQVTIKLEENEILVLYSDGVEAAFAGRHHAADVRASPVPPHFMHFAAMRRGDALSSLDAAIEHLAADLDSQAGSFHQDDDLTVLAFATTGVRELRAGQPRTLVGLTPDPG
ncbi:MAG: PP2C family protein-serine/threonine phosphatase [Phycisphaerales bacterium]